MDEHMDIVAVLIDVENVPRKMLPQIMQQVEDFGQVRIKRAYANWSKENLIAWKTTLQEYSIRGAQQFDYTAGKNASDMAIVIDAVDICCHENIDTFVLMSSDSDFTSLIDYLHEHGKTIIGVGEDQTPAAFQHACDKFIDVDMSKLAESA